MSVRNKFIQLFTLVLLMGILPLLMRKSWTPDGNTNISQVHGKRISRVEQNSDVNWDERFSFVPINVHDCAKLFGGHSEELSATCQAAMKEYELQTRNVTMTHNVEGSTVGIPSAFRAYLHLANHSSVGTICETGFNLGFSTFGWLHVNPRAHVYSFDIGKHPYAKPMAKYLIEKFPGRLNVTWGDSTKTLPAFIKGHPEVKCDLIIIDGGHTTSICKADLLNFAQLASPDNVVILDNYPQISWDFMTKLGKVWEWAKRNSKVSEIFKCHVDRKGHDFGFSVGRYLVA